MPNRLLVTTQVILNGDYGSGILLGRFDVSKEPGRNDPGQMVSTSRLQSSQDMVRASLERVREYDSRINAFISLSENAAVRRAAEIDGAPGGAATAPLKGRTIAIKDCIDVAGIPCTMGSLFFRKHIPYADASAVTRLKAAGSVVIGKANMHEFAYGGTTENEHFGVCRNPWNPDRIPGGSSGGSAAAIAAGFCDLALGTDTGSSVRMPAALCGVSGLRPTRGLVPTDGCFPVSPHFDVIGPMGRSVQDLADLLTALTGTDPEDSIYRRACDDPDISDLRIGVPKNGFFDASEPAVAEAVRTAMMRLEEGGARLFGLVLPEALNCKEHVTLMIYRDAAGRHRDRIEGSPENFGKATLARLLPGLEISDDEYAASRRALNAWERAVAQIFAEQCDLILTPTVPVTAPPIAADSDLAALTDRLAHCCWAWAGARVPALTIPCGFDEGLPIGLQLAAARNNDAGLLRAGATYQRVTDWHLQQPDLLVRS